MDVDEQIRIFREFIEQSYYPQLLEAVRKGESFLVLDFSELIKYNTEISEELLESPEELLKAAELAVKDFDLPKKVGKFTVRLRNLPESQKVTISEIRSKHLNKFVWTEGVVRQKSDVRPHVTAAKFECPSCGNILNVLQLDKKKKEPSRCGCGRKGKFKEISKELVDGQGLVLEESPEDLDSAQPKRINIFLKDDLVSPIPERRSSPGSRVIICGWVTEVPITLRTGGESTKYDLILDANYLEPMEDDFIDITIDEQELEEIQNIARSKNPLHLLASSLAPSIYGHEKVKEALVLQLAGGCRKPRPDGVVTRGDIHVLLLGDPGSGKSQLLKRISKVSPKARFTSGKGATGSGLCVAPSSLVLTNPGGMQPIQEIVEQRLTVKEPFRPNIWKQDNVNDIKIQGLSRELKLQSKHPLSLWKLPAPLKMMQVELASGKRIEVTPNTKLLQVKRGTLAWVKSADVIVGDFVGTPRKLQGGDVEKEYVIDLINSNPVVHNIKPFVYEVVQKLSEKYKGVRNAARILGINENNLYHNWVKEGARGNIKLKTLQKMCDEVNIPWKENIKVVSLYNGKKHLIPTFISENFLYFAGLVAGDGDLSKGNTSYSVRLSNSSPELIDFFKKLVVGEFGLRVGIQKGTAKRPTSIRTHSKILQQILCSLGIPLSPKSNTISLSERLLHLENKQLSFFVAGLFDTDGSVYVRADKKGGKIDLTTCSEQLARQIQLVLLRFEVFSRIRTREPSKGKIKGKYDQWVVEITSLPNIRQFAASFKLKHPKKAEKLSVLIQSDAKPNTNIDCIPNIKEALKKEMQKQKVQLKSSGFHHHGLSRERTQHILGRLRQTTETKKISTIAYSDIQWEAVKKITPVSPSYDFVYDFTVEDTHNFVVDGVLVHNTASVVKDEFLGGWSLEAGTLVLANRGFAIIDELDKMSKEDRSALHEALEQQSYHPSTEILFSDGSVSPIGQLVDDLMDNNPELIIKGKDCQIMPVNHLSVLTTDFKKIYPVKVNRVSRHKAPSEFVEIKYSHGRKIVVTPEHPIFIYSDGFKEIPAEDVQKGNLAPAPRTLPLISTDVNLVVDDVPFPIPQKIDNSMASFLGYFATEGHSYSSKNYSEIGISNTNQTINDNVFNLMKGLSPLHVNLNIRQVSLHNKATLPLTTTRWSSKKMYSYFTTNFSTLMRKAPLKRLSNTVRNIKQKQKIAFLRTAFQGDGFIDSERFGFSTSSFDLAKDYQDFLLSFSIYSYIAKEKRSEKEYYKVVVSGARSLGFFLEKIVNKSDQRYQRLQWLCNRSKQKNNDRDVMPGELCEKVKKILNVVRLDDGYFNNILQKKQNVHQKTLQRYVYKIEKRIKKCKDLINKNDMKTVRKELNIQYKELANYCQKSISQVRYSVYKKKLDEEIKNIATKKTHWLQEKINEIKKIVNSDLRFVRVISVKKIPNKNIKWVYDVTVEPNHTFISEGLVLHNTVSIAKANIQATLRCETTVLAAANPKFGRFDPYDLIANQINLPPTLINRFDLIFPIKDLPNREKDEEMASFILGLHKDPEGAVSEIRTDLLKKYFSYVRQKVKPKISDEAIEALKEYYISMRNMGSMDESGIKTIPITARQLEGLVRLAEASAKVRLAKHVTKEDARKAIELVDYCLNQIAKDSETGKIDIDRIGSRITATQRGGISIVKEIISTLESQSGSKVVPVDSIIEAAQTKNIPAEQVEEILEKLRRSGDVFEPKKGFVQRL